VLRWQKNPFRVIYKSQATKVFNDCLIFLACVFVFSFCFLPLHWTENEGGYTTIYDVLYCTQDDSVSLNVDGGCGMVAGGGAGGWRRGGCLQIIS